MATIIVKISGNNQTRRWTARADQLTFSSIQKRVADNFQTPKFYLTYKDDEDDDINVSTDEELQEAVSLALKTEPAVLRLKLVEGLSPAAARPSPPTTSPPPAAPSAPDAAPQGGANAPPAPAELNPHVFFQNLADALPQVMSALPPPLQSILSQMELDTAASAAANAAANAASRGASSASGAAATGLGAAAHAARLASGLAAKASDAAAGAAAAAAARASDPEREGYHPNVTCDRSGMSPIVGLRYNLIGHDYDLCEAEFEKLSADLKPLYRAIHPVAFRRKAGAAAPPSDATGFHPGVTCDKSGMSPIVGIRYHLSGHDYDLCQAEYDKLPEAEKLRFCAIPPPCGRGGPWRRGGGYGRCGSWGGGFGGGGFGGGGPGERWAPPWAPAGRRACHPHRESGHGADGDPRRLAARFVSDVSVHEGTEVAPRAAFTKIWRLKNSGTVPWMPGCKLTFVGGDQLSADSAVDLPDIGPVLPGAAVDVAVDMVAPAEPGRYVGYWRLTGPHGRRKFGQRVWVHIQVVADPDGPVQEPSAEDVAMFASARTLPHGDEDEADDDDDERAKAPSAGRRVVVHGPHGALTLEGVDESTDVQTLKRMIEERTGVPVGEQELFAPNPSQEAPAEARAEAEGAADEAAEAARKAAAAAEAAHKEAEAAEAARKDEAKLAAELAVAQAAEAEAAEATTKLKEAEAARKAAEAAEAVQAATRDASALKEVAAAELAAMGFEDAELVRGVVDKNTGAEGVNLERCVTALTALSEVEWDTMLDDLAEMGFDDRALNKKMLVMSDGSINKTVKQLVNTKETKEAAKQPMELD